MLQYKDISCVKWLGISITFFHFFWSISPPSLEAKDTEMCKQLNESEVKPGLACKCGDDPFHSISYVAKRYSYNMTCIDCPSGYYYEFEVFDCRPCPQPNHNCFQHNNARRDCISCDAMEPPSLSSQASTTETPTTSLPTEKPVNFFMQSTQTIPPLSREATSQSLLKTTSPAPSTTSPLTPKTSEATTKKTTQNLYYSIFFVIGFIVVCGLALGTLALVSWCCRRRGMLYNSDAQRNGRVPRLEMMELPGR